MTVEITGYGGKQRTSVERSPKKEPEMVAKQFFFSSYPFCEICFCNPVVLLVYPKQETKIENSGGKTDM